MPHNDCIRSRSLSEANEKVLPTPPRYIVTLKLSPEVLATFPHTQVDSTLAIPITPTPEAETTPSVSIARSNDLEGIFLPDDLPSEHLPDNFVETLPAPSSEYLEPPSQDQIDESDLLFIPETQNEGTQQAFTIEGFDMDLDWDIFPPLSFSPLQTLAIDVPQRSAFQFPSVTSTPDHMWMMITDPKGNSTSQNETVLPMQNVRYHGPPPQPEEYDPQFCHVTLFDDGTWAWYLRRVMHRPGDKVRLSGLADDGTRVFVTGRVTRVGFDNGVEWTEWETEMGGTYRCAPGEVTAMGRWNGW